MLTILFSSESRDDRREIFHLAFKNLKVREAVAVAPLDEFSNCLFSTQWSLWNGRPAAGSRSLSSTISDLDIINRLAEFHICESRPGGFLDPGDFLLEW